LAALQKSRSQGDLVDAELALTRALGSGEVLPSDGVMRDLWALAAESDVRTAAMVHRAVLHMPVLTSSDLIRIVEQNPTTEVVLAVVRHPSAEARVWRAAIEECPDCRAMADLLSRRPEAAALPEVRAFISRTADADPTFLPAQVRISVGEEFAARLDELMAYDELAALRLLCDLEPSPARPVSQMQLLSLVSSSDAAVRERAQQALAHLRVQQRGPGGAAGAPEDSVDEGGRGRAAQTVGVRGSASREYW
jgi:hypothetical protein